MPPQRHLLQKVARRVGIHPTTRVVVLGHQKTGTSAIGSLLALKTGTSYSQDPFYQMDRGSAVALREVAAEPEKFAAVAAQNADLFRAQIVKDPDFIYFFPQLKFAYPDAAHVFVTRRPEDMIRSIIGRLGLTVDALEQPAAALEQQLPNQHWLAVLGGFEVGNSGNAAQTEPPQQRSAAWNLLQRWIECNRIYFANQNEMHIIRYEDFCQSKASTLQSLTALLGLRARHDISSSLDRQFQPSGRSRAGRLSLDDFPSVAEMLPTVREQLGLMGYDTPIAADL